MHEVSEPMNPFELPLSERLKRREQLPRGTERILVLDDEPLVQRVTACELERLGYEVLRADCGQAALDLLADQPVDLVILDLLMPDMDGVATYREILKLYPGQKAVVYSGYAPPDVMQAILDMGAGPVLIKPVGIEQLALTIRQKFDAPPPPDASDQ